jgi:hypothetical protein
VNQCRCVPRSQRIREGVTGLRREVDPNVRATAPDEPAVEVFILVVFNAADRFDPTAKQRSRFEQSVFAQRPLVDVEDAEPPGPDRGPYADGEGVLPVIREGHDDPEDRKSGEGDEPGTVQPRSTPIAVPRVNSTRSQTVTPAVGTARILWMLHVRVAGRAADQCSRHGSTVRRVSVAVCGLAVSSSYPPRLESAGMCARPDCPIGSDISSAARERWASRECADRRTAL